MQALTEGVLVCHLQQEVFVKDDTGKIRDSRTRAAAWKCPMWLGQRPKLCGCPLVEGMCASDMTRIWET